jgi:hypothetical protein
MSETIYTEQDYIDADNVAVKRYEELTAISKRRHDLGPNRAVYVTLYDIVEKRTVPLKPEEYATNLATYLIELNGAQKAYSAASDRRRMIDKQLRIQKDEEL